MSARVFLGDVLVGELTPDTTSQSTSFEFDPRFASDPARPVFGRWFEDHFIEQSRTFRGAPLPMFFRNLLPEGALRKIVESRLGPSALPEYAMLLRLGEHLPGAVRVISDDLDVDVLEADERRGRAAGDLFRFSLTGEQPKLALYEEGDRLTVPVEGQDGFWIAKFGSPRFQKLVENEFTMLEWAAASGLNVPEHRIVAATEIENLPEEFEPTQNVLLVRRFDRAEGGKRIHQEDFAQVFGVAPEDRYTSEVLDCASFNHGAVGAVVLTLCGASDYREYLRRLVFMVLSGNADAHLKNWGLVYPDGLRARLAPVYDFVATVAYPNLRKHPALRWVEPPMPTLEPEAALAKVTIDDLLAAASYTEEDTAKILDDLVQFAKLVRETWPTVEAAAPPIVRKRVREHLETSALR
jgi:serine/threonine-protein kinase HipA